MQVQYAKVSHITDLHQNLKEYESPISAESNKDKSAKDFFIPDESFVKNGTFVLQEKFYLDTIQMESSLKFERAGARKKVYFKGEDVKAAVVTCGGLCPGLNVVIR